MTDTRLARQRAVADAIASHAIDVLLVTHVANLRWLTGFSGTAAVALVSADGTALITDFRYAIQTPLEVGDAAEVIIDRYSVWDRLKRVIAERGYTAIGVESHVISLHDAERASSMGARIVPVADVIETLRQVKDAGEIAAIRAAAALAHDALDAVLPTIAIGERELDVAARLEHALRVRGSEWHPFQTIVASGPRSALPHARSSERQLERGDLLLIDYGARVGGYCSDITRTVVLGGADERQRTVYELVREAQLRARRGARAGMTGREADALARDVIDSRGYGDAFGHSLGHGIGLEVHEAPRLAATAEAVLPAGAVVTVEPGIYLAGWGGVRLEDDILLGAEQPVLLSDGHIDLIILDG